VYLTTFTGVDGGGSGSGSTLSLAGDSVPNPDKTPSIGYKSIAKLLVRLTEMKELDSVWLSSASLNSVTDTSTADSYQWSVTARITPSSTSTSSAGQ
jgi:hypothetical protein